MLLDSIPKFEPHAIIGIAVASLIGYALYNRYAYGLHHLPGPILASLSEWYRLFVAWGWRPEVWHIQLHEEYGDVVRIGPNTVIVRDPEGVKKIYALNAGYIKSGFYPVQQMVLNGKVMPGFFPTQDEVFHAKMRRVIANAYAMSTLVQFEPLVDSTITAFIQQLNKFADQPGVKGILNFGAWLQWYAFDVIGELTFSKRLGFIDEGRDVDNIISANDKMLDYFAVVGQVPWLDNLFLKNPIRLWLTARGFIDLTAPASVFARERMAERLDKIKNEGEQDELSDETAGGGKRKRRDFLSRFLEANKKEPVLMDHRRVISFCAVNIFAGSDTTGSSLRAVFYYLLKNPDKLARLVEEVDNPKFGPKSEFISWEATQKMPYLCAVVQEALRLHPAVGLPLERIVPAQGLHFKDISIPGGTVVGTTAWGLHHNKAIFGPDPETFRPERWIDSPKEQLSLMTSMMFSFGMGSRTCIGKNISLLEIHKLVPALLRQYELSFAKKGADWKIHNAWFVRQDDFRIRIKSRIS